MTTLVFTLHHMKTVYDVVDSHQLFAADEAQYSCTVLNCTGSTNHRAQKKSQTSKQTDGGLTVDGSGVGHGKVDWCGGGQGRAEKHCTLVNQPRVWYRFYCQAMKSDLNSVVVQ